MFPEDQPLPNDISLQSVILPETDAGNGDFLVARARATFEAVTCVPETHLGLHYDRLNRSTAPPLILF